MAGAAAVLAADANSANSPSSIWGAIFSAGTKIEALIDLAINNLNSTPVNQYSPINDTPNINSGISTSSFGSGK